MDHRQAATVRCRHHDIGAVWRPDELALLAVLLQRFKGLWAVERYLPTAFDRSKQQKKWLEHISFAPSAKDGHYVLLKPRTFIALKAFNTESGCRLRVSHPSASLLRPSSGSR